MGCRGEGGSRKARCQSKQGDAKASGRATAIAEEGRKFSYGRPIKILEAQAARAAPHQGRRCSGAPSTCAPQALQRAALDCLLRAYAASYVRYILWVLLVWQVLLSCTADIQMLCTQHQARSAVTRLRWVCAGLA